MARLSSGHDVDVEAEAPLLPAGADEIDQVRQAFNIVQRAAIEAAAGQALGGSATGSQPSSATSPCAVNLSCISSCSSLDNLEQHAGGPEEARATIPD